MDIFAFELLDAGNTQAPCLEGAHPTGDNHGAGGESGTGGGGNVKLAIAQHTQFGHFLAEMKRGFKGFGLLQQPIDQFLRAADGQRRNVIDRLIGIQLGALTAGLAQGVDDVGADPEKPELEYLEESYGAGANDDRFYVLFRHVSPDSSTYGKSARIVTESSIPFPKQPDSILTVLIDKTESFELVSRYWPRRRHCESRC